MALLPLLVVLALVTAAGLAATVVRRSAASREPTVSAARRHAAGTGTAAVALGALAALATAASALTGVAGLRYGLPLLLAPLAFGGTHTAVVLVGELTWPRPHDALRRARLVRRGPLDIAPRWLRVLAGATAAAAVPILGIGTLIADSDGRSISRVIGDGGPGTLSQSAGPFPGSFYTVPAAVGLALLAGVTVAALGAAANRPAVVTTDDLIEAALRRASGHRVLRGATAAALVVLGGLLVTGGGSVRSLVADRPSTLLAVAGWTAWGLGGACVLAGLALLCVRAPQVPADQPVAV